jgi:hypothetical protein
VEFNIRIVSNLNSKIFSLFKIVLTIENSTTYCNIDTTQNYLRIVIISKLLRYYEDSGKLYYFVRLNFAPITTAVKITYLDVSTDSSIPEDFLTNDMILTSIPNETAVTATTSIVNPFVDAIKKSDSSDDFIYVLTTSINPPSSTHWSIYTGTVDSNWLRVGELMTGVYAWRYTTA